MPKNNWDKIGNNRRAGVLVPLFSVYSEKSSGIGGLADLKLLIDWCRNSGLTILQLLPMNEVGSTFCPYDAISSFALEPAYISLDRLSAADPISSDIEKIKKRFPVGKSHVNYGVKAAKMEALKKAYAGDASGRASKAFKEFNSKNGYWLEDFALFKALKDAHKEAPWYEWPDEYKDRDPDAIRDFLAKNGDRIRFEKWVQWKAFGQFTEAKEYAASKGVLMCGDLPILISRDSADVWAHKEFFKLDFSAGAPTDMYCAKGQRWGSPVYDWEGIASDGYHYLKEKLKFAENFYDMIRIDHVVGLFRIWSIPYNEPFENEGLNGSFDPKDENTWGEQGRRIISVMLESTGMLLCAEDLGVIPKVCTETLKEFAIPGNDVQRWTKDWAVEHDFLKPDKYRKLSVAMLSTHDTTNWPAWWENEAGTIDEALFIQRTVGRGIDCEKAMNALFVRAESKHGRLRWKKEVSSVDILADALGKKKEEIADFVDMYQNTYMEKEKLWKYMSLKGAMREKSDAGTVEAAFRITFSAKSIFRIELLNDYLYMAGILKGDPYTERINRPGTVSKYNWSLTIPISLEQLIKNKVGKKIKEMAALL